MGIAAAGTPAAAALAALGRGDSRLGGTSAAGPNGRRGTAGDTGAAEAAECTRYGRAGAATVSEPIRSTSVAISAAEAESQARTAATDCLTVSETTRASARLGFHRADSSTAT